MRPPSPRGLYKPRNLSRSNLRSVSKYRTRDLYQSHADRTGRSREAVFQMASQNPYRPRSTPVMRSADYMPIRPRANWAELNSLGDRLRGTAPGQIRSKVDALWLANRRTEAEKRRLATHAKKMLAQWSRQVARFDEESAWRAEAARAVDPNAQRLDAVRNRARKPKSYWVQDAWTEEVVEDESSDDENKEKSRGSVFPPRIGARQRNRSRKSPALTEGKRYRSKPWRLPENMRPGTPHAVPGMSRISIPPPDPAEVKLAEAKGAAPPAEQRRRRVIGSPLVPKRVRESVNSSLFAKNPRGAPPQGHTSFSPFQFPSYAGGDTFQLTQGGYGGEDRDDSGLYATAAADTENRILCDTIKTKLARYGIHVNRGSLERGLLAPRVVLSDKKREELLPDRLRGFPTRPPSMVEKKTTTKKKKGKGKKKKKGKGTKKKKKGKK